MLKNFIVSQNKLRLDRFLADAIPDTSRSKIQRDIEKGTVFVNGKIAQQAKFVVRFGDKIIYKTVKENQQHPETMPLDIVFENNDILIINKPAGLVVHPAPGYKGTTLVAALLKKYKDIKIVGEDQARPGIVHRLDKDTSGVMLVAKTQKMFEYLKDGFASRKIKKEYIALLTGNFPAKHGFINQPIGRHQTDFRKMTTLRPQDPKEAITEYNVIEHVDGYTLIRVKLHTGRTHQIRVHFSSQGFPVAGDALYGKHGQQNIAGLKRQFLHAHRIEVRLPDNTWIEAEAGLPPDLKNVLKQLKVKTRI